jgi:hypothetical protein
MCNSWDLQSRHYLATREREWESQRSFRAAQRHTVEAHASQPSISSRLPILDRLTKLFTARRATAARTTSPTS